MSRIISLTTLLILSLFVFVEVAQAGLIRSGGRPSLSRVYEQTVYYVNDQFNNAGGIDDNLLDQPPFLGGGIAGRLDPQSAQAFINGDSNPISAFPGGQGCVRGYEQQVVDDARALISDLESIGADRSPFENAELADQQAFIALVEVNDPCKWEFEQGEAISVRGSFQFVFTGFSADEVDYSVNWTIDGLSHQGEIDLINGQRFAAITLDKLIDLTPGEYDFRVSVSVSSDDGRFYYTTPESTNGEVTAVSLDPGVCAANPNYITEDVFVANFRLANPTATDDDVLDAIDDIYYTDAKLYEDIQCGYNSVIQDFRRGTANPNVLNYDQVQTFYSFNETLIIKPNIAQDPAIQVNAPVTLGTFLIGVFALGLRRRMDMNAKTSD